MVGIVSETSLNRKREVLPGYEAKARKLVRDFSLKLHNVLQCGTYRAVVRGAMVDRKLMRRGTGFSRESASSDDIDVKAVPASSRLKPVPRHFR